jgi:hypothetical protein
MLRALHGGKLGDIIHSMCTLRAHLRRLNIPKADLVFVQKYIFSIAQYNYQMMERLLKAQPYINDCILDQYGTADIELGPWWLIDFNAGRLPKDGSWNLITYELRKNNFADSEADEPWIVVEPKSAFRYVLSRNCQETCHGPYMPWREIVANCGKESVFLGHRSEHSEFVRQFGDVPYIGVSDMMDAAQIIAGAERCYMNQSVFHAIAIAEGKDVVAEISPAYPSMVVNRPNVINIWKDLPPEGLVPRRRNS